MSINMKNFFYKISNARFFTQKIYNNKNFFDNNLGIRAVIINITISLLILV